MFRLRVLRVYLRILLPLYRLKRLPFHADHEVCDDEACPLCFEQLVW